MANYGALKTMRAAAVGTIMPWTGALTSIPPGWIICNGSNVLAADYPLLAQVIGDTYGGSSGFSQVDFPWSNDTSTSITLPDIDQKPLADIDSAYFGSGAVDANIDTAEALSSVGSFIGANQDNGAPNFISDAYTDILFNYTPENDFTATIEQMNIRVGAGSKTVYTGARKLGRRHMPIHGHPTEVPTLLGNDQSKPGSGVACAQEVSYEFGKAAGDDLDGQPQIDVDIDMPTGSALGNGSDGVILANIDAEAPGPNLKPRNAVSHGISNWIGAMDDPEPPDPFGSPTNNPAHTRKFNISDSAPYALGGGNIATEHRNYDDGDANTGPGDGNIDRHRPYETFFHHSGISFNKTTPGVGVTDTIDAHDHSSFQVDYDPNNSTMRMPGQIVINDVQAQVTPDNLPDALNIQVTVPTPKLTVVYVIRAY